MEGAGLMDAGQGSLRRVTLEEGRWRKAGDFFMRVVD